MKGEKKMEEIEEIERKIKIEDGKLWKRVRNS